VAFLGLKPLVKDFTKLLKPLMAYWGRSGLQVFIYIDDILLVSVSKERAVQEGKMILDTLRQAGIVENCAKRKGPAQEIVFLGLQVCTRTLTLHIPPSKLEGLLSDLSVACNTKRNTVRQLARLVGKVISCILATGPSPILLCRQFFIVIASASSYDAYVDWTRLRPIFQELANELQVTNGCSISRPDNQWVAVRQTASDASGTGFAVCKILCLHSDEHLPHDGAFGEEWFRREFTKSERGTSSTHREMLAILELLQRKGHEMAGRSLTHWTDNMNAEGIVAKGSGNPELQELALNIHRLARGHGVTLRVCWISRSDPRVKLADDLSRFSTVDVDDFGLAHNESVNSAGVQWL